MKIWLAPHRNDMLAAATPINRYRLLPSPRRGGMWPLSLTGKNGGIGNLARTAAATMLRNKLQVFFRKRRQSRSHNTIDMHDARVRVGLGFFHQVSQPRGQR